MGCTGLVIPEPEIEPGAIPMMLAPPAPPAPPEPPPPPLGPPAPPAPPPLRGVDYI